MVLVWCFSVRLFDCKFRCYGCFDLVRRLSWPWCWWLLTVCGWRGDCVVVRFGGFVCDLVGLIACVAWVCLSIVFDLDVLLLGLGC